MAVTTSKHGRSKTTAAVPTKDLGMPFDVTRSLLAHVKARIMLLLLPLLVRDDDKCPIYIYIYSLTVHQRVLLPPSESVAPKTRLLHNTAY